MKTTPASQQQQLQSQSQSSLPSESPSQPPSPPTPTPTPTPTPAPATTPLPDRSRQQYTGLKSTLCVGCGHDQITGHIITACLQLELDPSEIFKASGIGCSSKISSYFLGQSYGINSIHGRMAPVATGVHVAQTDKLLIGISGDGDTASIGLGGFAHMARRNVPVCYVVANNGVYGLTKGQFSATLEEGARLKSKAPNPYMPVDLCLLALNMGASFVARSFSGDTKQIVPLLKAALRHKGFALVDVISPCVSFNNHESSWKSFPHLRNHKQALQELNFQRSPLEDPSEAAASAPLVDYEPGTTQIIPFPASSMDSTGDDGGDSPNDSPHHLILRKLHPKAHNVSDRDEAHRILREAQDRAPHEILTGLFYVNDKIPTLTERINLSSKRSLASLRPEEIRPTSDDFEKVMRHFSTRISLPS